MFTQSIQSVGVFTIIKTSAILVSTLGLIGLESIVQKAQAVSTTQTINFNESISLSGDFDNNLLSNDYFSGTVSPFDSNLGTLNSFAVDWNIDSLLNATTGSTGGSAGISFAGDLFLNGISYDGTGDGDGNGAGSNTSFSVDIGITNSSTFLVSDAGVTYPPELLSAVTGSSDFELLYNSPLTANYSGIESGNITVTGSAILTYDFESAVSVPFEFSPSIGLLSMVGIFGLLYLRKRAAARQLEN